MQIYKVYYSFYNQWDEEEIHDVLTSSIQIAEEKYNQIKSTLERGSYISLNLFEEKDGIFELIQCLKEESI